MFYCSYCACLPITSVKDGMQGLGEGVYIFEQSSDALQYCFGATGVSSGIYIHNIDFKRSTSLKFLDLGSGELGILPWVAEVLSHKDAGEGELYKFQAKRFIERYKVDTNGYDLVAGFRTDGVYFNAVKCFVRNQLDYTLLEKLFMDKYHLDARISCVKSKRGIDLLRDNMAPGEITDGRGMWREGYINSQYEFSQDLKQALFSNENTGLRGLMGVLHKQGYN